MLSKFINLFKFVWYHPYLRKLNEVKQRTSKKSTHILGNGKKI